MFTGIIQAIGQVIAERIMGKLETKIPPIGTNTKKFEALK
jgi:riboflavin synthase alpha subunit